MSNNESPEGKENTIKLTISLDKDNVQVNSAKVSPAQPLFKDETRLFDLGNLYIHSSERNTEHGKTVVRVVDFVDDDQRKKVLQLVSESFSAMLQKLIPLIRGLGYHPSAEIRKRASRAAGELLQEYDFIEIKNEILQHWARSISSSVNLNVGLALAMVASNEQYADNIKMLLKHWITSGNPDLRWTAVASLIPLGTYWPDDILEYIEIVLKQPQLNILSHLDLLSLTAYAIRDLCKNGHGNRVMDKLAEWIQDEDKSAGSLRLGAALIFLDVIELKNISEKVDRAVQVFHAGLSDRRIDNVGAIRKVMLEKLRSWVEEASDSKRKLSLVEKLIIRLHLHSDDRGRERIVFHLERWSRSSKDSEKSGVFKQLTQALVGKEG